MTLVAHWKLNDLATLVEDSSGYRRTLTNLGNTGVTTDATFGTVADFSAVENRLQLNSALYTGTRAHTISFWFKRNSSATAILYGQGDEEHYVWISSMPGLNLYTDGVRINASINFSQWNHCVIVASTTSESIYIQGVRKVSGAKQRRPAGKFQIGGDYGRPDRQGANSMITDFRIYSGALSATDVESLYSDGPNPRIPLLTSIPRVSFVASTITPVNGAIAYRLTSQKTGSSAEKIVANNFSDLEKKITRLSPQTEYTIRLYSTTDGSVYTLIETVVTTTLANLSANYNKNDYLSNGRFNITNDELVSAVLDDVFDTGDILTVNVSGRARNSKFVNRGDTVDISETEAVIAPFSTDGGSGQSMNMTLSDSTSVNVSFNETTQAVTIGSTLYEDGDSLVLDGKKVTIAEV